MNQQVLLAKQETVAEISKSIKEAGSVTVVSYQGLTVAEMQELRRTLGKIDSSIVVYKNTLVRRALAADELPDLGDLPVITKLSWSKVVLSKARSSTLLA